ncbi:MAG: hypothetical protein CSA68_06065 [Rhodobacterales bacterium]|nr:MAG: hypothetical protein CSA68_06065 [Rhodobacterales bacterium]
MMAKWWVSAKNWIAQRLKRQFLLVAAVLVLVSSAVLLPIVIQQYRNSILKTHEAASLNVNLLLQAALENAMLKRDLEGLQGIVQRLGTQPDVAGVMIATPEGEVRFSSYQNRLGTHLTDQDFTNAVATGQQKTRFQDGDASTGEVLRSTNPLPNQPRCQQCHGAIADNPINGVLIVDYDASNIRALLRSGAIGLAVLGVVVLILLETGIWLALKRLVLNRVDILTDRTQALSDGDLSVRVPPLGHDEIDRFGQHFNDMADHLQRNVKALESARQSLQTLIDAIPDGVRVTGPDFRIIMANRAYCKQVGADPVQIAGQFCYRSSHGLSAPCVPTMTCCPISEILHNGKREVITTHVHKDQYGGEFSVEVSAAPVRLSLPGGEQDCVVESIRDMEKDISISHKQRLAEMGSLAAGVAHEVNNPLSAIALALNAVSRQPDLPDSARQYLDIAEAEIANCQQITESLLRLSSRPSVSKELVELGKVISDTATLLRLEAEQAGVEITQDIDGNPRILARDSDMRTVLFNLALNAIHAMPEGGQLMLKCYQKGGKVFIQVRDTGVGIPERDRAKVLLPFWTRRSDGSRGRGLGLAICASIVKQMEGVLDFYPVSGGGTCFEVVLSDEEGGVV